MKRGLAIFGAVLMVLSAVAPAMAVGGGLNYTDGKAPNPYFDTTVTTEDYAVGEFTDPLAYYDDSGEMAVLPGNVNSSDDVDDLGTGHVNPYTLTATDISVDEFGEFPRAGDSDGNESILHANGWTTQGGATVTNVTTAPDVDAVEYAGAAASDNATYTLTESVTSDVEKRYVQIAADISSASGTPTLQLQDADGDYVEVELYNATADQTASDVLANATGEGHVLQTQIGTLTVEGTGDGTMGEISAVYVAGDVDADFSLINAEKKGKYQFGEKYVDTDDDDDLETETIYEPHGAYSVNSLDSFGSTFDNAHIMGVTFPAHIEAAELGDEDVQTSFSEDNNYPNWDSLFDGYFRMELPSAYDLSFSSPELKMHQDFPGSRYVTLEYAEDTGDTEFDDLDDSDFTSVSSSFDSQGEAHSIDNTISIGQNYVVHLQLKLTNGEANAMQATGGSGGGGIFGGSSDGGLFGFILSPLGAGLTVVAGLFARAKGWLPF